MKTSSMTADDNGVVVIVNSDLHSETFNFPFTLFPPQAAFQLAAQIVSLNPYVPTLPSK